MWRPPAFQLFRHPFGLPPPAIQTGAKLRSPQVVVGNAARSAAAIQTVAGPLRIPGKLSREKVTLYEPVGFAQGFSRRRYRCWGLGFNVGVRPDAGSHGIDAQESVGTAT